MNFLYVLQECSLCRLQMFLAQEQPICVIQLVKTDMHHEFHRH